MVMKSIQNSSLLVWILFCSGIDMYLWVIALKFQRFLMNSASSPWNRDSEDLRNETQQSASIQIRYSEKEINVSVMMKSPGYETENWANLVRTALHAVVIYWYWTQGTHRWCTMKHTWWSHKTHSFRC
jgi:hypothetical protein